MTTPAEWHKSTYSANGHNCVECQEDADGARMRDTQNRERGHLTVPRTEWTAFLAVVAR